MSRNGKAPDERAPLLPQEPAMVDGATEALADEGMSGEAAQSMSLMRGIFCLIAMGTLVFLQGK